MTPHKWRDPTIDTNQEPIYRMRDPKKTKQSRWLFMAGMLVVLITIIIVDKI